MVVQVMLVHQVQPCKRRPLRMWEFNPEGPRAIQHFLEMMHEEMYKSFFGPQIECLDTTEDVGLSCNRPDTQVSNPVTKHFVYIYHNLYSENPVMARNGLTRQRESGVRHRFPKARLVLP